MLLYDFSLPSFESQSRMASFLASEFHDIRASRLRVARMRKSAQSARRILKFHEILICVISPRPCGNAAERNRDSFFSRCFFFFFFSRRNEFHANFAQHRPHNATRRLFAFAINYHVRAQLWRNPRIIWMELPECGRLFRERTSVCVPRNGALRAVRPRFADVIGKEPKFVLVTLQLGANLGAIARFWNLCASVYVCLGMYHFLLNDSCSLPVLLLLWYF